MIGKSIVLGIGTLIISPFLLISEIPLVFKVLIFALVPLRFLGSLVAFESSDILWIQDDIICFRRRFKKCSYSISQLSAVSFSELSYWQKLCFSQGRMIMAGYQPPIMTLLINESNGGQVRHKVFVNILGLDKEDLKTILANLKQQNPALEIPDVDAFIATISHRE